MSDTESEGEAAPRGLSRRRVAGLAIGIAGAAAAAVAGAAAGRQLKLETDELALGGPPRLRISGPEN